MGCTGSKHLSSTQQVAAGVTSSATEATGSEVTKALRPHTVHVESAASTSCGGSVGTDGQHYRHHPSQVSAAASPANVDRSAIKDGTHDDETGGGGHGGGSHTQSAVYAEEQQLVPPHPHDQERISQRDGLPTTKDDEDSRNEEEKQEQQPQLALTRSEPPPSATASSVRSSVLRPWGGHSRTGLWYHPFPLGFRPKQRPVPEHSALVDDSARSNKLPSTSPVVPPTTTTTTTTTPLSLPRHAVSQLPLQPPKLQQNPPLSRSKSSKLIRWLHRATTGQHPRVASPDVRQQQQQQESQHHGLQLQRPAPLTSAQLPCLIKKAPISRYYEIGRLLGRGSFGEVRSCTHKLSGKTMAVKIMQKYPSRATRGGNNVDFATMFRNEVSVLSQLSHPNIVEFHEAFEGHATLYAVLEHCDAGDLFHYIVQSVREQRQKKRMLAVYLETVPEPTSAPIPSRYAGPIPERDAVALVKAMLQPLAYLHAKRCAHRDVKAQNFLFSSRPSGHSGSYDPLSDPTMTVPSQSPDSKGTVRSTHNGKEQQSSSTTECPGHGFHDGHPREHTDTALPLLLPAIQQCPVVGALSPIAQETTLGTATPSGGDAPVAEAQSTRTSAVSTSPLSSSPPNSRHHVRYYQPQQLMAQQHGPTMLSSSAKESSRVSILHGKRLVLIDFGMSSFVPEGGHLKTLCGSPHYVAPEILSHSYGLEVDMWAFGVIVYLILYGKYPFDGVDRTSILRKIQRGAVVFPTSSQGPSRWALDFVQRCLARDAHLRMTAAQALCHPWLQEGGALEEFRYPVVVVPSMFSTTPTRSPAITSSLLDKHIDAQDLRDTGTTLEGNKRLLTTGLAHKTAADQQPTLLIPRTETSPTLLEDGLPFTEKSWKAEHKDVAGARRSSLPPVTRSQHSGPLTRNDDTLKGSLVVNDTISTSKPRVGSQNHSFNDQQETRTFQPRVPRTLDSTPVSPLDVESSSSQSCLFHRNPPLPSTNHVLSV